MSSRVMLRVMVTVAAVCVTVGAALPSSPDPMAVGHDLKGLRSGERAIVRGTVGSASPDRTTSVTTLVIVLPRGFTAEGAKFPEACSIHAAGRVVTCGFAAGLNRTATAEVWVRVGNDVPPGTKAEGRLWVLNAEDRNWTNNHTVFTLGVDA